MRDVLNRQPDALLELKRKMQETLIATGKIPLEKIGALGEASYPENLDETDIAITDTELSVPISIPGFAKIKQVAIPLSSFAAYVDPHHLPAGIEPPAPHQMVSGKKIALTFDDGPSAKVTPRILATLKKYQAKATFFVLGSEVAEHPGLVKAELDAGHQVANHSWSHPQLTKLSDRDVAEQILKTQMVVYQQTGYFPELVRPPYGAVHKNTALAIGLPIAQWSEDTEDWKYKSGRHVTNKIVSSAYDGGMILMHDIHPTTADGLDAALKKLKELGYQFVTVDELLQEKPEIGHQYFDATDERAVK